MSLVEVMVSSVLVGISSTAALGVWNQAAALVHDTASMERKADDLEMLRLASHRWLAQRAAEKGQLMTAMAPCRWDAVAVAAAADAALPLPEGITRQWTQDSQLRGLWQELALVDDDGSVLIRRRQLLSPAAFGLCRP